MNRIEAFAVSVLCCGALGGCSEPAAETTVSRVTTPPTALTADADDARSQPQTHKVHKEVAETETEPSAAESPAIPQVYLTSEHSAMCRVRVGDQFPTITLPQLSGGNADLAGLHGKKGTVVLFWGDDPWMSETALADLAEIGASDDVALVGIAVHASNSEVKAATDQAGTEFPQLLDADGKAFDQVGMTKMPRIYVLNGSGEIVWFDIEYSQSTQRELKQTLAVLTAGN